MKAAVFDEFRGPIRVQTVPVPECPDDGAVIRVAACGICRSDWHGWMGHDPDIRLPHVPGHELAGTVACAGSGVRRWSEGDRVTVPFCCGCGICEPCRRGHTHICHEYTQPGFTQWGAFAEYVVIRHADVNLVALPDSVGFSAAASLGCRFATAFRGIVTQARLQPGQTLAVFGCGGVGLSAVMIGAAAGARVAAVDVRDERLEAAAAAGADVVVDGRCCDPVRTIRRETDGGADVAVDALGSRDTCRQSVLCLRRHGRQVQIGLTLGPDADPSVPMSRVVAFELKLIGSHGMPAVGYRPMLEMIESGRLQPERLISSELSLEDGAEYLTRMDAFPGRGPAVIRFS